MTSLCVKCILIPFLYVQFEEIWIQIMVDNCQSTHSELCKIDIYQVFKSISTSCCKIFLDVSTTCIFLIKLIFVALVWNIFSLFIAIDYPIPTFHLFVYKQILQSWSKSRHAKVKCVLRASCCIKAYSFFPFHHEENPFIIHWCRSFWYILEYKWWHWIHVDTSNVC